MEYCTKHGIIVEAYSPLIRGKWTDKIVEIAKKVCLQRTSTAVAWSLTKKCSTTKILRSCSSAGPCSASESLTSRILFQACSTSLSRFVPLPKSSQPARVISNANIFDFEISAEDMEAINALDRGKDGAVTWNPVDAP